MNINGRVKRLRKDILGFTQQEFADKLTLGRASVAQIESGKVNITDRNIKAICDTFGVSEDWLRTGEGDIFVKLDIDQQLVTGTAKLMDGKESFEKSMIAMMMQMDDEDWTYIKKFIKKMAVLVDEIEEEE